MRIFLSLVFCISLIGTLRAQVNPSATPFEARLEASSAKDHGASLVKNLPFENIGPTVMSGRVTDIDVHPDDPTHFYVAYASGGLWKTKSNGSSFEAMFDNQPVMTIGDIAVDWSTNPETVWVGTGEKNSSRSSYSGVGMFVSRDLGVTWEHKGLPESHHIARIVLDAENSEHLLVAVLGHLYSPNQERGVYRSMDGGSNWTQVLFVDENSGAIDLIRDIANPERLYASTWTRERRAWNFLEGGTGSGIHRSDDNGATWVKVTSGNNGFPQTEGSGRIGLDVHANGDLWAILDNQDRREEEEDEAADGEPLTKDDLREMNRAEFLNKVDQEKLAEYLEDNSFPEKYKAKEVLEQITDGELDHLDLVSYLEDANAQLFDTPVKGAEVYKSSDGGETWVRTHEEYIDGLFNTYGYYFGEIRVDPLNPEVVYILGVPFLRSEDGGATWASAGGRNVHSDHQALWVSPDRAGHLINGNDGGLNMSYDSGESWFKLNSPQVGQFYDVEIDMAEPYKVYGGLQDNGVWVGPSSYTESHRWHQTGRYPYENIMGGDGMQTQVDFRDNTTVYTGLQFGNYSRLDRHADKRTRVKPRHELGDRPLRFNWLTPIHLSRHNEDILYMGSNKMHRSLDQGETFEDVSGDLTRGGQDGDVPFGTLTSIDESSLQFGLVYVGSDDGLIHMSVSGGPDWKNISDSLPSEISKLWVSRVEASHFQKERVYASFNGYRWDHFESYVYVSENQGETWKRLGLDLPTEPVNVIHEDPFNEDILYVGTDHGVYISLDRGEQFMSFSEGLFGAPVHDVLVHPRDGELIVGTHGRSIFKADLKPVHAMVDSVMALPVFVYEIQEIKHSDSWGDKRASWSELNLPERTIVVWSAADGEAEMKIQDSEGGSWYEDNVNLERGLNYIEYDLSVNKKVKDGPEEKENGTRYLEVGEYDLSIKKDGVDSKVNLVVEE